MNQDDLVVTVAGVVRPMNQDELAQYAKDQAEFKAAAIAKQEAQAKRVALLDKLGITEDEAKLLLG